LILAGVLSLVGLPVDPQTWARCIREQRCPDVRAVSVPAADERALWSGALLLVGAALLLPDRWWRRRQDLRALEIVFDPEIDATADAYTVVIRNGGRRRVSGLTVRLTAWSVGGPPKESDKVILSSLRRRRLVPVRGDAAQGEHSLGGHEALEVQVVAFQKDRARWVFTFGDAVVDAETSARGIAPRQVVPVPAGRYRVLIAVETRGGDAVERYFSLTVREGEAAMAPAADAPGAAADARA
jgi:hypothetical protein